MRSISLLSMTLALVFSTLAFGYEQDDYGFQIGNETSVASYQSNYQPAQTANFNSATIAYPASNVQYPSYGNQAYYSPLSYGYATQEYATPAFTQPTPTATPFVER